MELLRDSGTSNIGQPASTRSLYWMLVLLSLVPLCVVLPVAPTKVGVAVMAAWTVMIWVAISFIRGQFHSVVPLWVAFYPYCYYLFTFPKDRPIFTVDRAFILLLVIQMFIVSRQSSVFATLTRDVRISAYLWGLFLVVCFFSVALHAPSLELGLYRLVIEGMLMPALFGLYAIRYFPLLKDLGKLHASACMLGFGLCVTALIEITTDIDLFPWSGSEPMFTDTHVRRADGPFEQQIVLSVVATLAFFFIIYLRRLMPHRVSVRRAMLHRVGCVASLGAALLPLNRGLIVALAPIAAIDCFSRHRLISRRTWVAFFSLIVLATIATKLLDPQLYEDRVSRPDNVYQRLAQHQETLRVVHDYLFFGVGAGLYQRVASGDPRYMGRWNGVDSMNVQHNVLMTVLSDQGIVGLSFYAAAQVFFIRAMWKIRKVYPPGWLAFLYCLLVYMLIGLDYATVYFFDINLLYMFILGILYQQQARMAREQGFTSLTSLQVVEQT
jgi:hypothetical protein